MHCTGVADGRKLLAECDWNENFKYQKHPYDKHDAQPDHCKCVTRLVFWLGRSNAKNQGHPLRDVAAPFHGISFHKSVDDGQYKSTASCSSDFRMELPVGV